MWQSDYFNISVGIWYIICSPEYAVGVQLDNGYLIIKKKNVRS